MLAPCRLIAPAGSAQTYHAYNCNYSNKGNYSARYSIVNIQQLQRLSVLVQTYFCLSKYYMYILLETVLSTLQSQKFFVYVFWLLL